MNLGTLTGGAGGLKKSRYGATYTWTSANTILTVTVGARTSGNSDANVSTGLTFAPTTNVAKLLSTTGGFHVCASNVNAGDNCQPTTTGSV